MATDRLVAIHQPNFFPWLGYFDKLARADVFVVLDNVALVHTGGSYTNRVQILIQGQPAWITMPAVRGTEARSSITHARIVEDGIWRKKISGTVRQHYAKAPYFRDIMPVLDRLIMTPTESLRDFNLTAIRALSELIGLDSSKIRLASELTVSGRATNLLIEIVRAVGGTAYLAGGGASGYQEDDKFVSASITLHRQAFRQVEYTQLRTTQFVPGLSIIDALMNCGAVKTADLIGHQAGMPA